jgi:hypothetical protein
MTDLDRIIAACEIAQRAVKRRKTQAFTAEEEPIILQGLASVPSLLLSLLDKERQHETQDYPDSTGTLG